MSEKERMLAGELYFADDPELNAMRLKKRKLEREFNDTPYDAFELRASIIRELFGSTGKNCYVEPPFHCDYGCNTQVGDNFYANFDCIFLDVAPITIGNNVFFGPRVGLYTRTIPSMPACVARGWKAAGLSQSATMCGSAAMWLSAPA